MFFWVFSKKRILTEQIQKYGLFDAEWYVRAHPELKLSAKTAWRHFKARGFRAGLSPTPLFDPELYLKVNPDVAAAGTPAFVHYLLHGTREARKGVHYLIDHDYIASQVDLSQVEGGNPLIALATSRDWINPRRIIDTRMIADQMNTTSTWETLCTYAAQGAPDDIIPHLLFDPAQVRASVQVDKGLSALEFYIRSKGVNGVRPHRLVDPDHIYLSGSVSLPIAEGSTFLEEVMQLGSSFRGSLSALFDTSYYLSQAGEIVPEDMLCLEHFMRVGWKKGYRPNHWFDPLTYASRYLPKDSEMDPLTHYAMNGREPHIDLIPDFCQHYYTLNHPEVLYAYAHTPLEHYISHGMEEDRQSKPVPAWTDEFNAWNELSETVAASFATPPDEQDIPEISVIIPVYNEFRYTLRCIWSIIQAGDRTRLEIIVADDGSSDETEEFFSALPGLRYIRHPENLGFLRSCNRVAALAQAPVLYFLNNDTAVLPGWIDSITKTLRTHPDAGLVGSKLVYPNGLLQEAGGYIWSDGNGCNVGRNSDPVEPGYNYLRDVDYVSGAGIAVRRDVWDSFGGFDERYTPAYCEDSDLAMTLRQHGWRVLYQPCSEVVHFEGVSSGTSTTSGVKAYQVINQKQLLQKWDYALAAHAPNHRVNPRALVRPVRPRICVIDATVPTPDKDAGSVTALWFMRLLLDLGYDITFLPNNTVLDGDYGRTLQGLGIEVLHAPYVRSIKQYLRDYGGDFDCFFLYRVNEGGQYYQLIHKLYPQIPVVFDTVDLHYLRQQREAKLPGADPDAAHHAMKTKKRELALIRSATATIVLSEREYDILTQEGLRGLLSLIPLVLETRDDIPPRNGRDGIAFVGGYQHTPNVDAVLWFCQEIWPLIRSAMPNMVFHIVGSNPPEAITSLNIEGVVVHGFIADLDGFLDQRIATVAPLQYGAGIKGKVGSSMAAGVPCIATPIAVEGMGLSPDENVLVAESPQRFADQVKTLCGDTKLWSNLSMAGLQFVHDAYSPDVTRKRLLRLLAKVNAVPFSGTCPITGVKETRRFLKNSLADSLSADTNSPWSSERVLAHAVIERLDPKAGSLRVLAPDPQAGRISTSGRLPVLTKVLEKRGLLGDQGNASLHLARILLDDQAGATLDILLKETRATELFIACPPTKSADDTTTRKDAEDIQALVARILKSGEWDARVNRNQSKETAMTKVVLIQAKRKK